MVVDIMNNFLKQMLRHPTLALRNRTFVYPFCNFVKTFVWQGGFYTYFLIETQSTTSVKSVAVEIVKTIG